MMQLEIKCIEPTAAVSRRLALGRELAAFLPAATRLPPLGDW